MNFPEQTFAKIVQMAYSHSVLHIISPIVNLMVLVFSLFLCIRCQLDGNQCDAQMLFLWYNLTKPLSIGYSTWGPVSVL